jgi:proteic killer suppression protein
LIQSFSDNGTEDIFKGSNTKKARKSCPKQLHDKAHRKLHMLHSAGAVDDLDYPGNRFEYLSGAGPNRASIRINDQYRIEFNWTDAGPKHVEITKHYGD